MPPAVQNMLTASIPLPVVVVLVINAAVLTWWTADKYSDLNGRVTALERAALAVVSHETRVTVMEHGVGRIREDLAEIKVLLRERKTEHEAGAP